MITAEFLQWEDKNKKSGQNVKINSSYHQENALSTMFYRFFFFIQTTFKE